MNRVTHPTFRRPTPQPSTVLHPRPTHHNPASRGSQLNQAGAQTPQGSGAAGAIGRTGAGGGGCCAVWRRGGPGQGSALHH